MPWRLPHSAPGWEWSRSHELIRDVSAGRWMFVIGLDGKIAHIDRAVNAAADSDRVLEGLGQ